MTKKQELAAFRVAGFHDDARAFLAMFPNTRVSVLEAAKAYIEGSELRRRKLPAPVDESKPTSENTP